MLIIDAHLDLAWNALQWNRDLLCSVYTIRTQEAKTPGYGRAQNTVALPEMRKGRIAVSFATVLARNTGIPTPDIDYRSQAQAYAIAQGQLAYYHGLEDHGHGRVIADLNELNQHVSEWEAWDAEHSDADASTPDDTPPLGFIISMEGADPILEPDQLEEWWDSGLQLLGLSHYGPGRYAGGTGTELGLSDLGAALLDEMERLGMFLDLSHLSDQAFWEVLDRFNGAVLASHNNCRALVPHQRQFSDEQLQAIIERGGVVGAALDAWMLLPGWVRGQTTNEGVLLEHVVDHLDHVCQLAGNSNHAALGTDLDGGFGRDQSPFDLDTVADLQRFNQLLADRGYSEDDVANILHGNWLRLLRRSWTKPEDTEEE